MSRAQAEAHPNQRWVYVLILFFITSIVEATALSQVFAFMPIYFVQLGLPLADVPAWTGFVSAASLLVGLPLVPFWGVWADKYSRKAIIIRSCLVEAVVLGLVAGSREPWELAAAFTLSGFQLGNSGVMLSAMREVTPTERIGLAVGLFGASWPVGSAVGPAVAGLMVDGLGAPLWSVFALGAVLSAGAAVMLLLGYREERTREAPSGPVLSLAFGAVRGVFSDPTVRLLFGIYGISFLARQICSPFVPLLVQSVHGDGPGLASSIAWVVGVGALAGGLISPAGGALGDRLGFRRVLLVAMAGSGLGLFAMVLAPDVASLTAVSAVFAALSVTVGVMVTGLLTLEVAPERRSATLNLIYLPLYLAGIVGPALGTIVAGAGLEWVFILAGGVYVLGALLAGASAHSSSLGS